MAKSILGPDFHYTPASMTDIRDTFRKYGFKPTTNKERKARNQALLGCKEPDVIKFPSLRLVKKHD